MTGGLIQIANYGIQDIFLTGDPSVSFYKQTHKRYTNFATETHSQTFLDQLDFGQESELVIDNYGDLLYRMYLVVDLPGFHLSSKQSSPKLDPDTLAYLKENDRVAQKIYSMSDIDEIMSAISDTRLINARKRVTIDINLIDIELLVRYWVHRLSKRLDLFIPRIRAIIETEIPTMVSELVKPTSESLTSAWINHVGNALIERYEISVDNQIIVNHPGSWLTAYHNLAVPPNKRDCYNRLVGNVRELTSQTGSKEGMRLYIPLIPWFSETATQALPLVAIKQPITVKVRLAPLDKLIDVPNLSLGNVSLLTERVFLDDYERDRFIKHRHEYLVHQLQYELIEGINADDATVTLSFDHPTKYVTWSFEYEDREGLPQIESLALLVNDKELSEGQQDYVVYEAIQPYLHFPNSNGQAVYSFSLHPLDSQPSGSINLSRLVRFGFRIIFKERLASVRMHVYAQSINVFRIAGGFGALAFT